MSNSFICFTSLPDINCLLCLFATIKPGAIIKTTLYNAVVLKCRQLIFENMDIIARPNFEGMYGIYIVFKEEFYERGNITDCLNKYNLNKANSPFAVPKHIYEECCFYTIAAKLTPKWNLISDYLVRGRDFLTVSEPTDCIHFGICINAKGKTTFIFKVNRIKLPKINLNKLDLPDSYLKQLDVTGSVDFKELLYTKTIRVLPSLKKGNILSIKKKLTESSAMKTYQQIKRHWKNTYGYRLPESEEDLFYLELQFFDGSPIFTYPSVCVRPYEPVFLQRIAPAPIVGVFMTDLLKMVPNILGDRYPVPMNMSSPTVALNNHDSLNPSSNEVIPIGYLRNKAPSTQNSAFVTLPTQKSSSGKPKQKSEMTITQLISELDNTQNKPTANLTQESIVSQCISQTQKTPAKKRKL